MAEQIEIDDVALSIGARGSRGGLRVTGCRKKGRSKLFGIRPLYAD